MAAPTTVSSVPVAIAGATVLAEDLRGSHAELARAATVLASKLWYGLARAARSDLRPATWTTFFRIVRSAAANR